MDPFERVPSASSEILGRTVSTGVVLDFELYKYTWMYKIPLLPSVQVSNCVPSIYNSFVSQIWICLMSRASCRVWIMSMVRP